VRNIGGQTLHWRSAPSLGSTTIAPPSGSVAPGQSQTVSVTQPGPASTASNISIVSDGGQTLVHFTCAPTPTPVPPAPTRTPTPPPAHANLVVSAPNKNASENCNGGPAAPYSITLNNTGSDVSVGWQFVAAGGWAIASPSSNTIGAGQTATVQVTPSVCPSPGTATTYQATLHLSFPQGGSQPDIQLSDVINGPPPVVNFVASFQATGNQRFNDTCYPINSTLPAITVTLDNTLSNVPVSWTWEGVTTDGTSVGSPWQWASPSPPSATVPAGQKTTMQATPLFPCPAVGGNTYTAGAVLQLTFPQGGSQGNPLLVYTVTEQTPVF
jgi:hypothetical protein